MCRHVLTKEKKIKCGYVDYGDNDDDDDFENIWISIPIKKTETFTEVLAGYNVDEAGLVVSTLTYLVYFTRAGTTMTGKTCMRVSIDCL